MHNSNKKVVHFFVDSLATSFVRNEILQLSVFFDKVNVYVLKVPEDKQFPANVIIHEVSLAKKGKGIAVNYFFSISYLLLIEFFKYPSYIFNISILRMQLSTLIKCFFVTEYLKKNNFVSKDDVYYSFWMNDWAIILALLKRSGAIKTFSSRVHGADLYEERVPKIGRLPFRWLVLKNIGNVFSVSKTGLAYLKNKYQRYSTKFSCFYLGTTDYGSNPFKESEIFTIVSCAHVRNIKRIYLIAEYLKKIQFPLKWIHIGAEQRYDKTYPRYTKAINDLKSNANVNVELLGDLPQEKVFELYSSSSINLFVSLSATEGLPVSIMEAISFGIPVLATDVGGCKEIVNEQTGKLVNAEIGEEDFLKQLREFKDSEMNASDFRNKVRKFWELNFSARNNYSSFFKAISS